MTRYSLLMILALAAPGPALALTQDDILAGQLRPGWQTGNGRHMAALHLRLAPSWKTYWRAPGDAGIPPSFDWSASRNLKSVKLHWPAPEVFDTNGMTSVGYHDELVLPIEVVPLDPSQPVHLATTVDLGVCKDICIPASLTLTAELLAPGKPDGVISRALAARPATGPEAGVRAHDCALVPISDGMRLTTRIQMPGIGRVETVVVEPGIPGVWVSEAEVSHSGQQLQAIVDMVPPSGQPFSLTRDAVIVTVIGRGGRAVELSGCPAP